MGWKNDEEMRAWFRKRYAKNVERVQALKLERGCADCGYNKHHYVLEFDHIQPRLRGTVASQMGKSWAVISEEITRCEVVCANCHAERTYKRRVSPEGIEPSLQT